MNALKTGAVIGVLVAGGVAGRAQDALKVPILPKPPAINASPSLEEWTEALVIPDFKPWLPDDKGDVPVKTIAHLGWGADGLYIAIEALDPDPSRIQSFRVRRDAVANQDSVTVDFDPTGVGHAAISVTCNPMGIQSDAALVENGGDAGGLAYDLHWESAGTRTDKGFVVKIRIPFTSLQRLPGSNWKIRISRNYPRDRVYTMAWPQQPFQSACDLCHMGSLSGAPITSKGSPFLVIPTVSYTRSESAADGTLGSPTHTTRLGADLRYAGPSFTLVGTVRPDFSAVEADVDPLIVNSRFKYQYPEKRPFFQGGLDLFGATGAQQQFSSRSILDPEVGLKAWGQKDWGSWGLFGATDKQGGDSIASDGASGLAGLRSRDLVAAMKVGTDKNGSSITTLVTDQQFYGDGGGRHLFNQTFGAYVDQRFTDRVSIAASGVTSLSRLPEASGSGVVDSRGSATLVRGAYEGDQFSASVGRAATSPDLLLGQGFVDLNGYVSESANATYAWRTAKSWWTYCSLSATGTKLDAWDGSPINNEASMAATMALRGRLSFRLVVAPKGAEWVNGIRTASRAVGWRAFYGGFDGLVLDFQGERRHLPDYTTGLPAIRTNIGFAVDGNRGPLRFVARIGKVRLDDEGSGATLLQVKRGYALTEYALPHSFYLRVQGQVVRTERSGSPDATTRRYLQALGGWQPTAFTHVYVGYTQTRNATPLNPSLEAVQEKGLFGKVAYSFQF